MQWLVTALLYVYLQLVYRTTRWQREGDTTVFNNAVQGRPQILLFWHGRLAMMTFFKPEAQPVYLISSRHRDGQLVGRLMRWFGVHLLLGSSRRKGSNKERGGTVALRGSIQALRRGAAVAITPDGPRGPRMRVGGHAVNMAKMTGADLVPMTYATSRGILLGSWDRFLLPLPFSRGIFLAAPPISVPKNADTKTIELFRQKVEDSLNALTARADHMAGRRHSPEPA